MERSRMPLVFGQGVDRDTGVMAVVPGSMEELTNVYLHEGRAVVRRGLAQAATITDATGRPLTDVTLVHPLRAGGAGLVAGWVASDRTVHVVRVAGTGEFPTPIGQWGSPLHSFAEAPPRFLAAETFGQVFLAHDEPALSRRLPTVYYEQASGTLKTVSLEWEPGSPETVYFRGVTRHLDYLIGWGWGTEEEPRPELVRISLPGQPLVFERNHYFVAGHRGDPVIACVSVGNVLLVFKESETWRIEGYDRTNFGIRLADPRYGLAAARLAVTVGDTCFFWSLEGPRMSNGGESVDLSIPLDLLGPQPVDLEAMLPFGFAVYQPVRKAVLFVFGRHVYCLNLRNASGPRWTYLEYGAEVAGGGVLYGTIVSDQVLPGYVTDLAVGTVTSSSATITWARVDAVGDEELEVWLRKVGDPWGATPYTILPVFPATGTTITGLDPGEEYEVAFRARRLGIVRPEFSGSTPDTWPAGSRTTFTTTLDAPTIESAVWSRTSATQERIRLTIHPAHLNRDIQILRGASVIATVTPSGDTFTYDDVSDDEGLQDPNAEWGERMYVYTARHVSGGVQSAESAPVTRWAGPDSLVIAAPVAISTNEYNVGWQVPLGGIDTVEVWDNWDDANDTLSSEFFLAAVVPPGGNSNVIVDQDFGPGPGIGPAAGQTIAIRLRHRVTTFGVVDYSDFVHESLTLPSS